MENQVKSTLKQNAQSLKFMQNKGQLPNPDVLYYLEGKQGSVFIERNRIRFSANDFVFIKKILLRGLQVKSPLLKVNKF
ncbi:MAG: hypothetical protein IPG21_10575 [Saprospiraceae bacterium]|nr:hypothetical protein [Candidatus Vicinibacter affinis]